jgi:hypothetical protein
LIESEPQEGKEIASHRKRWGTLRSPAIDAGSDDAWGYDTTSTNPKVIDLGQPDIGYHYYRRVADDDPVNDQVIEISFRQPPRQFGDSQVKAYGYRLFKDGGALVNDINNPSFLDVLTKPMEQPTGLDEKGQYNLDLKTYYWIDKNDNDIEDVDPDNPTVNEVFYSKPAGIRLVVEWD